VGPIGPLTAAQAAQEQAMMAQAEAGALSEEDRAALEQMIISGDLEI
jgi:hypothetical protein